MLFRPLRDDEVLPVRTHRVVQDIAPDKEETASDSVKKSGKKSSKKGKKKVIVCLFVVCLFVCLFTLFIVYRNRQVRAKLLMSKRKNENQLRKRS